MGWFRAKRRCRNKRLKGTYRFSPWARKILDRKQTKIQEWSYAHHQRTVAETAYPFTLDWNDWTNNQVGLSNQGLTINHRIHLGKSNFV